MVCREFQRLAEDTIPEEIVFIEHAKIVLVLSPEAEAVGCGYEVGVCGAESRYSGSFGQRGRAKAAVGVDPSIDTEIRLQARKVRSDSCFRQAAADVIYFRVRQSLTQDIAPRHVMLCQRLCKQDVFPRPATYLAMARSCTSRHQPRASRVFSPDTMTSRFLQPAGRIAVESSTP